MSKTVFPELTSRMQRLGGTGRRMRRLYATLAGDEDSCSGQARGASGNGTCGPRAGVCEGGAELDLEAGRVALGRRGLSREDQNNEMNQIFRGTSR